MNDNDLIEMLSSEYYNPPYQAIEYIINQKKISLKILNHILNLEDKLVVGEFLEKFIYLSDEQLKSVENYIRMHIKDRDALFVSSLIESANVNSFLCFYNDFLNVIRFRRNDLIVLAALDFIFENLQLDRIKDIVNTFRRVINNKSYYQNCQVIASLYLFRITYAKEYLIFLEELIMQGGESNRLVLRNSLTLMEYNQQKYFSYHDKLIDLINKTEEKDKS